MDENLLQFIWKNRLLTRAPFLTTEQEEVSIIHPGEHNSDAGPDFFNARVKIGDTLWAGNIELHLKTSDWNKHAHTADERYSHIILHVVYENDTTVNVNCPVLELKNHISTALLEQYRDLMKNMNRVSCEFLLPQVKSISIKNWLDRLLVERMHDKCKPIEELLSATKNNFEETFYIILMRSLGLKINSQAFELTARALPVKILSRHKTNLQQLEALFFGCAGLLHEPKKADSYTRELFNEFQFLKHKYNLEPIPPHYWKWLRLRPSNFPEVRLAQMAALVFNSSHLLSKTIECATAAEVSKLFTALPSPYWDTHYRLNKESGKRKKPLGESYIQLLLINAIVPFVFMYGRKKGDDALEEKALSWLEQLPAENNTIIRLWEELGIKAMHAADSQSLLKLKKDYCNFVRCLHCNIGKELLSKKA